MPAQPMLPEGGRGDVGRRRRRHHRRSGCRGGCAGDVGRRRGITAFGFRPFLLPAVAIGEHGELGLHYDGLARGDPGNRKEQLQLPAVDEAHLEHGRGRAVG